MAEECNSWSGTAAIYACSPRRGGNSDLAAELMARGVRSAGGEARVLAVRDYPIEPCLGCHACAAAPGCACVLMEQDRAEELFAPLLHSPVVLFSAPIYFYHLPARFKGFIDRSQRYYELLAQGGLPAGLAERQAHVAMVAGRPTGERLFEGSLLTLKYFLLNFRLRLGEKLLMRGKDGPNDLAADPGAQSDLVDLGRRAWLGRREA